MRTDILGENITLRHGDCLELMRDIPAGSVDLVLADLPYGTTRNKWDTPIDLTRFWRNVHRVTKQNAAILLFGQMPYSAVLVMSNIREYRYEWVYQKTNPTGFLNAKKMPLKCHEQIHVFYRALPKYNPQFREGEPYCRRKRGVRASTNYGIDLNLNQETHCPDGQRYPLDVIVVSNPSWGPDRGCHPTQKPVALLEYMIRTYTDKGETVLDCCMGSGSTGVACVNTGRCFIGIELDERYFEIAEHRIFESYANSLK